MCKKTSSDNELARSVEGQKEVDSTCPDFCSIQRRFCIVDLDGTAEPPSAAPLPTMAAGRTVELQPTDILCRRGPANSNHPGTVEFRALAANVKARHHNARKDAVDELMQELKRRGLRFVEKAGDGYREVLDDAKKKRKCVSTLGHARSHSNSLAQNAPASARGTGAPVAGAPTAGEFENAANDDPADEKNAEPVRRSRRQKIGCGFCGQGFEGNQMWFLVNKTTKKTEPELLLIEKHLICTTCCPVISASGEEMVPLNHKVGGHSLLSKREFGHSGLHRLSYDNYGYCKVSLYDYQAATSSEPLHDRYWQYGIGK